MSQYHKGVYSIKNKEKYVGKKPPIFRSSWEKNFMYNLDNDPNVKQWCSECLTIPYIFNNSEHNYFVDFLVVYQNGRTVAIEIKPSRETKVPKKSKNKSSKTLLYEQLTYLKNMAKWKAAYQFCSKRNIEFKIITEKSNVL
jgi:hypothetical protein